MGLGAAVGALIPFFQQGDHSIGSVISFIFAMIATLAGIILISWAGVLRDKATETHAESKSLLRLGFILATLAGISTAAFNVGFNSCESIVTAAVARGYSETKAGFLPWIVIFTSGVIANIIYALFLQVKNGTYRDYAKAGAAKAFGVIMITGVLWLSAILLYGAGAGIMGKSGPVIGWIIFLAVSLVVNTALGVLTGEWKNALHSQPVLYAGNALLGVSWFFMGFI